MALPNRRLARTGRQLSRTNCVQSSSKAMMKSALTIFSMWLFIRHKNSITLYSMRRNRCIDPAAQLQSMQAAFGYALFGSGRIDVRDTAISVNDSEAI